MTDPHDPEEGDRPTPVPEGDPEWPERWRQSGQECWEDQDDDE